MNRSPASRPHHDSRDFGGAALGPSRTPTGLLWGAAGMLLAACAAITRPASTDLAAVTVDRDYEGLYRSILENARRCYPPRAGADQREVEGMLDTQARTASVNFAFRSRDARETFMTVDVRAVTPRSSKVSFDTKDGSEPQARTVRGWVEGTSNDCPSP
jgi:hypothetical protein